jgi:hypothetical protein
MKKNNEKIYYRYITIISALTTKRENKFAKTIRRM